jgi:hypothetical protein
MKFHPETLNPRQRQALAKLGPELSPLGFYLGGGTALGLQLGHRHSIDLDWFHPRPLENPRELGQRLDQRGTGWQTLNTTAGTLIGKANGVECSAMEHMYAMLLPVIPVPGLGCSLASPLDLAAMKLGAIGQRGAKKDFVDLYCLGKFGMGLAEMIEAYRRKYRIEDMFHVLHSLVYFEDADRHTMPRMLWKVNWREIKKTIAGWVKAAAG